MSNKIIQSKKLWFLSFLTFLLLSINSSQAASSLGSRLSGYILLQVESLGEAWYIIPKEQKRVYLQNGSVAYQAMRELSLGITNSNLAKIPVGIEPRFNDVDTDSDGLSDNLEKGLDTDPNKADTDNDGFSDGNEIKNNYSPLGPNKLSYDNTLVNRLKGYILLQVEKQGQAWYLNPKDGKRYYMQDGEAAYNIMRFLSLGITNNNLKLIPISDRKFTSTNNGNSSSANQGNNNNNNSTSTPPTTPPGNGNGGGGGGGGGGSNPPSADTQVPTTPTNLLSSISGTQVSLSWTASSDNVGVVGYQILRSTTNGSGYAQIATSNTNSYTNTGLSIGTTYYYVVKAYDAAGNYSANSNQATATIANPTDTQAPTTPTNLTVTASGTQITIAWTASTDNVAVARYSIERSLSAGSGFQELNTTTNTSYIDTGLSNSTTYYYRVRAQDTSSYYSNYTSIVNAITGATADTTAPTVPSNLAASVSGSQVSLSWTASTDSSGVTGYMVWRSTTSGGPYSTFVASTNTNSYVHTGVSIGTYYYVVRAYDAASNYSNNSTQIIVVVSTVSDTTAPSIPSSLSAVPSGSQISLSWTASTDANGVAGYNILRSQTSGSGYQVIATSTTNSYINTSLANGTYYYVVRAYDAAFNYSGNSTQAQGVVNVITPPANGNPLISGISGTISDGSTVSISGSGFGAKSIAAPLKWDNFEAGASYPVDTKLDTVQPEWVQLFSAKLGGAMYTNRQVHSGSRAVYNAVDRPGNGLFIVNGQEELRGQWETNWFRTPLSNTLFISYWFRVESQDWGVIKMSRITSSQEAGGGGVYNEGGSMNIGGQPPCRDPLLEVSVDGAGHTMNLGNTYFSWDNCGEWVHVQMGRTLNDIGQNNGWAMGDIVGYERQNWENLENIFLPGSFDGKSLQLNTVLLGLMVANFVPGDTTAVFIDDMYIDNTRAHIEIGNNPVYENSTHREMQLPTTWSSAGNNIQFTVNKGSFTSGQSVYLFVVNENGSVSPGYGPIVIQ